MSMKVNWNLFLIHRAQQIVSTQSVTNLESLLAAIIIFPT